jgi:hypothetical protein
LSKRLHIVCLDAPSPPDYGGVFDLYYKIPALAAEGFSIHLHYFAYKEGRGIEGLEPFCEKIYSYPRSGLLGSYSRMLPYIVGSRISRKMILRLNEDEAPVLLEGIHCCGIIPLLDKRKQLLIRVHNDEAVYYRGLLATERDPLKKAYFAMESKLLERFQKKLPSSATYLFVSDRDRKNFAENYGWGKTHFLPCFLPWQSVSAPSGKGDYCLYQGNISVAENREAAQWLIREVFAGTGLQLVIAGRKAQQLETGKHPNVKIVSDPDDSRLEELIAGAHIHVLPSFNQTGVKLKLLHALFHGRFCLANPEGVAGSGLEGACVMADGAADFKEKIVQLSGRSFDETEMDKRRALLAIYDNKKLALRISELL